MNDAVLLAIEGPLARITLNRPGVLNAENLAWVQGLEVAVAFVAAAPDVRVVLLRGAGRAFCAGMDRDMVAHAGMPPGFYDGQERAFAGLEALDAITIAALHGYCIGGGLQLAIACDIRVCSSDCRLSLPAVQDGVFPGMSVFRLPRLIGLGPARRLILSGEPLTPAEALRLGLIDYLLPAEAFDAGLNDLVGRYLRGPRAASIASKRLLRRVFDASFATVFAESLPLMAACLASPEMKTAGEQWLARRR